MTPFETEQMLGVWEAIATVSPDDALAVAVPVLPHGIELGTLSEIVWVALITVTLELPVALL